MSDVRYVLAVLVVCSIPPAVVWWYVVHPFVDFWRRVGPAATIVLLLLAMFAAMFGLFTVRHLLVGSDLGTSWTTTALGAACLVVTVAMALGRRKLLTTRILAGVPELSGPEGRGSLLTEGVYARVRNPRYIEVMVGTLGYALIANWTGPYVVTVLLWPALHVVVLLEERELRERFGEEFEEYRRRVPRWIPRRRPAP